MDKKITIDEYQDFVDTTWVEAQNPYIAELRLYLGLIGELGELSEKTKKFLRDSSDPVKWRNDITYEIGDLLYYVFQLANFYDISIQEVLVSNVEKLTKRLEENKIKGEGDYR